MCRCRRNHRGDRCVESPMTIDEPLATPELVFRRDALSEPGMSPERFAAEFRLLRGEAHIGRGEMLTARQRVIAIASAAQGDPVVGGQAPWSCTVPGGSIRISRYCSSEAPAPPAARRGAPSPVGGSAARTHRGHRWHRGHLADPDRLRRREDSAENARDRPSRRARRGHRIRLR